MYYLLFRGHRYYVNGQGFDVDHIKKIAPSAKIFGVNAEPPSIVQQYFKLLDNDDYITYLAIEVEDETQAGKLQEESQHLLKGTINYQVRLVYVFKDIDRDKLDKDAILLKLTDQQAFHEDTEVTHKADQLTHFNRKFNKFMAEVEEAEFALSDETYDALVDVSQKFAVELEAFRAERKKAKANAVKVKTALKNKLMHFAIYKDGR